MKHYKPKTIRASKQKQIHPDLCLSRFLLASPFLYNKGVGMKRSLKGISFAKEWIKSAHYLIENGTITIVDYIRLLKQKIKVLKRG